MAIGVIYATKAHQLARSSSDDGVVTTTAPDDVFYILKLVLSRLISTGRAKFAIRSLESIRLSIDTLYLGCIKKKLDNVYSGASLGATGSRADKAEKDAKLSYIVILDCRNSNQLTSLLRFTSTTWTFLASIWTASSSILLICYAQTQSIQPMRHSVWRLRSRSSTTARRS
jgi:hypothetical protein